jgi:hypothetical protein
LEEGPGTGFWPIPGFFTSHRLLLELGKDMVRRDYEPKATDDLKK